MRCCVVAIALIVCGACGLSFTDTIVVDLPVPPDSWRRTIIAEGVSVSYLTGDDTVVTIDLAPETRSATLRVPKRSVVPVVALLSTDDPAAVLLPAGAVYPWHLSEDGTLRLEWEHGFISNVLLSCTASRAQAVNVAKLTDAIVEASSGNPWSLDPSKLRGAIERGQLNSRSLSKLPVFDLEIEPAQGRWISGNPLDSDIMESSGFLLVLSALPEGVHTLYNTETRERIGIQADLDGWTVVFSSRGAGSTGSW